MRRSRRKLLGAITVLLLAAWTSLGLEHLAVSLQCPNVVLVWPSAENETYIVQWRPTLDQSNDWVTLTNGYAAALSTNYTSFTHSNQVNCILQASADSLFSGQIPRTSTYPLLLVEAVLAGRESYPASVPPMPRVRTNGVWLDWEQVYGPLSPIMLPISAKLRDNVFRAVAEKTLIIQPDYLADGPLPEGGDPLPIQSGFYRVVREGLHVVGLTNGLTVHGVWSFPIELGTQDFGKPQIRLKAAGNTAAAADVRLTGGSAIIEWNTQFMPNGTYEVYAECDFPGGDSTMLSTTNIVTVQNPFSFDGLLSSFGEQMWVYAEVSSVPVDYEIAMFDDETDQYLGSFIDTSTNGLISFLWDLTDGEGNTYTNHAIRGEFFATDRAARGSSTVATNRWNKDTGWSQDAFAIAWANTARIYAPSRMRDLMRYGVVDILGTTDTGGYTLSPGNVSQTDQSFNLTASNKGDLLTYLGDPSYRNFYFFGHANAGGIGDSSQWAVNPPWITETELRSAMTNYLGQGKNPGRAEHPYRFVFLDACNTANGNLCEAFGIHRVPEGYWSASFYVNVLKMKPRVFIGYTGVASLPSSSDEHIRNAAMLGELLAGWRDGASINGLITRAKANTQWPLDASAITYGAWNLWRYAP